MLADTLLAKARENAIRFKQGNENLPRSSSFQTRGTIFAQFSNVMNAATTMLMRLANNSSNGSVEDRCRRGSLPLKKRRFYLQEDETSPSCTTESDKSPHHDSLAALPEQSMIMTAGRDEQIAALALVAAAASTFPPIPSYGYATATNVLESSTALKIEETPSSTDDSSLNREHHQQPTTNMNMTPATKRMQRPPLASPLAGGCHGRTSRNNSYCRRQPCYNGTNYCKLHYQHYIVAGIRTPMEDDDVVEETPVRKKIQSTAPAAPLVTHQDKRFTGASDEMRCLATTTRGRVCAYVSVNGSKYCHLHADYDTNPPPRRGNSKPSKVSTEESPFRLGAERSLRTFESVPGVAAASSATEVSLSPPPSVAWEEARLSSPLTAANQRKRFSSTSESPTVGKPSRRNPSKLMHAASPFPLLSSIATDQWFHKTVKLSAGPFTHRVGRVEKWGNGWVSVRIPGVGMHNRRAFELLLHSQDKSNESQDEKERVDSSLMRCVSREAVSPSPSSGAADSDAKTAFADSRRSSSSLKLYLTEVPETPRSDNSLAAIVASTPVPSSVGDPALSCSDIPHVTPSYPRKTRTDDVPLVETLQLAEEGNVMNYNLELLFGTAALERGMRTHKKVTRYEDTAMLEIKKGRKLSLGQEDDLSAKRKKSA